ncbi:unnamed protein product [Lactuca virosa]|uniref:Uncharacterized protein n=1 Tax=Lactuca virosa TaxID=75947 RepID=A0AAU9PNC8_9ASTR|nr:unnamed protein product [Lactuca virosa]
MAAGSSSRCLFLATKNVQRQRLLRRCRQQEQHSSTAYGFVGKHSSDDSLSLTNIGSGTNGDIGSAGGEGGGNGRLEACWRPQLAVAHVFSGMAQWRLVLGG